MKKIPESFESVKDYLGFFVSPLLEETRAQLQSSMEILYRAPFAEVVDFEETKPFAGPIVCGTLVLVYVLQVSPSVKALRGRTLTLRLYVEVGLPTAPESGDPVSGWDQEFQNGTIGWHPDESGTWGATE